MSSESSGLKHTAVGSFIVIVKQSALLGIWTAQLGLLFNRRRSVYAVDMAVHHRRIAPQSSFPSWHQHGPTRNGVYTVDVDGTTACLEIKK